MKLILQKPDNIGVLASTLCMIHCLASPFLFIAQTCSKTCCVATPMWWKWIDYLFIIISFFAIRRSTQLSTNNSIKLGLWLSWIALLVVIINENIGFLYLSETYKYIAAFSLVALHLYNQKYCQCKNDKCCTHHG
jgi:hypothetical protein